MRSARKVLVVCALVAMAALAGADEGMWMLHQVRDLETRLRAMGCQLSADELWNPASGVGLASATPWLGGCSSSFVSPDGLIVTNHHCAFSAIQINSSPEHDYITNGFLARTRAEELPARTSQVMVFVGYEEVTSEVRNAITSGMSAVERAAAVEPKGLVAACENGLRC